jgi:2'-5' RNA ligase
MTGAGTFAGDAKLRLFVGLLLPDDVAVELRAWGERHLSGGRLLESFHVTLAFLGTRPASELDAIVGVLRDAAGTVQPFTLEPVRYRETRSVGMLVLEDLSGEAARLAERLQAGLEALGVYRREARPWLPHVTLLRFPSPGRPRDRARPSPPPPEIGGFAPSEAAAFLSRLHPRSPAGGARYEILEKCPLSFR